MAQNKVGLAYLEAAKAVHSDRLTRIEVPEFGENGVVYGKPPTLEQRSRIVAKSDGNNYEAALYTVIELAIDEQGNKLFTLEEKHDLKNRVSADVIEALATRLNAGISYPEARKK